MKNIFKAATNGCKNAVTKFGCKHPELMSTVVGVGVSTAIAANNAIMSASADTTSDIQNGIKEMVSIVTTVVMGVGIIIAIIAIFNWVSAMHEEDSARQSKAVVRVIIGAVLIIIKPISYGIVKAVSHSTADTYMSGWNG